ncbi:MAG: protein kinase [Haloarculaceae archaeon]
MSESDPNGRTGVEDGDEWSNRHWRRLKFLFGSLVVSFLAIALALAVENPPESDASFATAPVSYSLTGVFAFLLLAAPFLTSYFISRDKAELDRYFEGVAPRAWYTVLLFNAVTSGVYALWYCYVRWQQIPDRRRTGADPPPEDTGSAGSTETTADRFSEVTGAVRDALVAGRRAVASRRTSGGRDPVDAPGAPVETTGESPSADRLAAAAPGEVDATRLGKARQRFSVWLYDDPPVAYLEDGEQPAYLLRHANERLRVTHPDGREEKLGGRLPIGERYLLVTDRRLVYLSGNPIGDDTARAFRYEDLASVGATDGFTGGELTFTGDDGTTYTFPTATSFGSKVGLRSSQVAEAADYVRERLADPTETGDERVEPTAAAEPTPDDDGGTAKREPATSTTGGETAGPAANGSDRDSSATAGRETAGGDRGAHSGEPGGARSADGDDRPTVADAPDDGDSATAVSGPSDAGRSAVAVPQEVPSAPDVRVDHDELTDEQPIGSGGNADVTRATLSTADGDVTLAVKRPRMAGTLHSEEVERLLEEAETWSKLDDHDHVVGIVDYGADPLPWIAMEYMDGGDLGDRAGEMDAHQALWTAIAVTKGVRHAHRRGVAHLDLKPENVLFRTVGGAWDVPKVADWGLSKQLLEHSKSVEGISPHYAAPEQFDDDYGPADDITDVYQLGAVFYELFTGRPPFEGTPTQVMRGVMAERPTPPSELADVPDGLDEVLMTALARERDDRYESVLLLRNELQDLSDW